MKNIIHAVHRVPDALLISDIADIIFDFRIVVLMPHIILFFFISAENANLTDIRIEKPVQHRISKGAGSSRNQ